jgi:L-asparagine transporter-like permease
MIAVQIVLLGFTASNCIIFSEYVLFAFDKNASAFTQKALAVGLLTSVILIHGCFRKTGIFVQNVLGYLKLALITFMVLTSLFVVLFKSRERSQSLLTSHKAISTSDYFWGGSVWDWGTISTALFKVFYSYSGLQNVNNVMNEVKNPVKTLKSAATAALLTALILYLLVNVAYFLIVPMDEIKESGELIAALFFEKVFGKRLGKTILPLTIATSAFGNVMVVTFSHVSHALMVYTFYSRKEGTTQPRNSSTRFLAILASILIIKTIQLTTWRPDHTLHPLSSCAHDSCEERVFFHSRSRRLSWSILRTRHIIWLNTSTQEKTRFRTTLQSFLACSLDQDTVEYCAHCCPDDTKERSDMETALGNHKLRICGIGTVSFSTLPGRSKTD